MRRRRLLADPRGASAVEFALLAPVFLGFLFSIIEGGRMIWQYQMLREVAFSTVRCMSVDKNDCDTTVKQKNHAIARAAQSGTTLTADSVTITANTTCNGNGGSNKVAISIPFQSPAAGLLGALPSTITASACFPAIDV